MDHSYLGNNDAIFCPEPPGLEEWTDPLTYSECPGDVEGLCTFVHEAPISQGSPLHTLLSENQMPYNPIGLYPSKHRDCFRNYDKMDLSLADHEMYESRDAVVVYIVLTVPEISNFHGEHPAVMAEVKVTQSFSNDNVYFSNEEELTPTYQKVHKIDSCDNISVLEIATVCSISSFQDTACAQALCHLLNYYLKCMKIVSSAMMDLPEIVMDAVVFVQVTKSGQVLRPVLHRIPLVTDRHHQPFVLLASFSYTEGILGHKYPSEDLLKKQSDGNRKTDNRDKVFDLKEIKIVDKNDQLAEAHGARGGRPVHKQSGHLLMTSEQVQKVLEIRRRWEGLSPRQRRENIFDFDFYPFLTLNRDETAECLGVCATWLKDAIRAQGMFTWPGRPLRRSGAYLQGQKELLESSMARLQYTASSHPDRAQFEREIERIKQGITDSVEHRIKIVQKNVSKDYFQRFLFQNGPKFLNPTWNALPPTLHTDIVEIRNKRD